MYARLNMPLFELACPSCCALLTLPSPLHTLMLLFGAHAPPAEGSRLWAIYRGYEQSLLEAAPSDEEQAERVRALWARQLAVPLADGAETLASYEAWERSRPGGWAGGGSIAGRVGG